MRHRERKAVEGGDIGSVDTYMPLVHIVRPLKKHLVSDADPMPGEAGYILVKLPVQLHIFDEASGFENRLQPELYNTVKSLWAEGEKKIHIRYEGLAADNRAKVEALCSQMGFYRHQYEGKPVMAFDRERFEAYMRSVERRG